MSVKVELETIRSPSSSAVMATPLMISIYSRSLFVGVLLSHILVIFLKVELETVKIVSSKLISWYLTLIFSKQKGLLTKQ